MTLGASWKNIGKVIELTQVQFNLSRKIQKLYFFLELRDGGDSFIYNHDNCRIKCKLITYTLWRVWCKGFKLNLLVHWKIFMANLFIAQKQKFCLFIQTKFLNTVRVYRFTQLSFFSTAGYNEDFFSGESLW
jgi:hypothetical protein